MLGVGERSGKRPELRESAAQVGEVVAPQRRVEIGQVHPRHLVNGIAATLNSLAVKLRRPRAWTIRFAPGGDYALEFDGGKWGARAGEGDGSAVVQTRPEALAACVMGPLDG
ncbi:MAG TPA: hypothetical protein VFY45_07325, partial [Baekduia sp.]|nr:hypothetical protein [Baekduia sp.]